MLNNDIHRNFENKTYLYVASNMVADSLAPLSAMPSVGAVMTGIFLFAMPENLIY